MALITAASIPHHTVADEAVWESHRNTLRDLYLVQDMSLSKVMHIMKTVHGFHGTKAQYERYLTKKWKFRKNLKEAEWKAVNHHIKKRKRTGRESEMMVNGVMIDSKKVKKETQRYSWEATFQPYIPVASPDLPDGIVVYTPKAGNAWTIEMANLPFARFEGQLSSHSLGRVMTISPQLVSWMKDHLPDTSQDDANENGDGPHLSLERILYVSSAARQVLSGSLIGTAEASPTIAILKTMIFLLSNNITNSNDIKDRNLQTSLLDELLSTHNFRFTFQLLSVRGPTMEAFAERLFGRAIETEREEATEWLLRYGVSPNRTILSRKYGPSTSLHLVAMQGNPKFIRMLLDYGADVAHVGSALALSSAAVRGHVEVVRLLLKAGVPVNSTYRGESALNEVICCEPPKKQQVEIIEVLLEHGADPCLITDDGTAPLDQAAIHGSLDVCVKLLEHGAGVTTTSLCSAARGQNMNVIQLFVDRGAHPNSHTAAGEDALKWAVHHQDFTLVKLLLDGGANVENEPCIASNCRGDCGYDGKCCYGCKPFMTALQVACCSNDPCLKIIGTLLQFGANIHAPAGYCLPQDKPTRNDVFYCRGQFVGPLNAIQAAAKFSTPELIAIILAAGVSLQVPWDQQRNHPVYLAARYNSIDAVQTLLEYDPTALEFLYVSPIPDCISYGRMEMVQFLLQAGMNVDTPCHWTNDPIRRCQATPLSAAISAGHSALVEDLLARGANVNNCYACTAGRTALSRAVARNDHGLVQRLLDLGAWPQDPYALKSALERRNHDLVDIFLNAGTNVNAVADGDLTVLQVAIDADIDADYPFTRKILAHGADVSPKKRNGGSKDNILEYAIRENPNNLPAAPLLELLITHGADIHAYSLVDDSHLNPLQIACRLGKMDIIRRLLDAGADINALPYENKGLTALQAAAIMGFIGIATFLLEHGADVNASGATKYGRTALEGAAEHSRIDMLQLLINAGADLDESGEEQREVAIGLAEMEGHYAAAKLILSSCSGTVKRWTAEKFRRTMKRRDPRLSF